MRTLMTSALAASAIFATIALTGSASAMPVSPLQGDQAAKVEQTRWVCGWRGHCFRRPNFHAYNYYVGPPRFYGGRHWRWRHRFWHHRGW